MAGKNQHYIPQFLQTGFSEATSVVGFAKSAKSKKRDSKVWVFEKHKSYPTSPRNKGSERFFYGLEDSALDQTITDAEQSYSKIVRDLRTHSGDTPISCDGLPEMVSHMLVRTKNIRQTLANVGKTALDVLDQSMVNMDGWTEVLIKHLQANPDGIGQDWSHKQRQHFMKIIRDNPEEIRKFIKDKKILEDLLPLFRDALSSLKMDINEIVQNTHIDVLSESIEPLQRVNHLREFSWFLSVKDPGSYILGDAIVICQKSNGEYNSFKSSSNAELQYVFLPISSQHLLIGGKDVLDLEVDPETINRASASLSCDFFIASQNTARETEYQQDLGSNYFTFQNESAIEMQAIIDRYWNN